MSRGPKYDQHYRDDPAACGAPFAEFRTFCGTSSVGSVLDLGCGQGRDALMFARAGHRVVGVDVSSVGVRQMVATAEAEGLEVDGVIGDIRTYVTDRAFDVVILDRVLHMLDVGDRLPMVDAAMNAVVAGGHLLVAEGPKGMTPVRARVEERGWMLVQAKPNRLIAARPSTQQSSSRT